jgi:hypothetical protein
MLHRSPICVCAGISHSALRESERGGRRARHRRPVADHDCAPDLPVRQRRSRRLLGALMKGVVEKLTNDDIVAISAFAASLEP